ncbi:MAG: hypothetical protein FWG19_02950 [Methanomassiliicoccaceae archaeon]|nr:hypothetical protein [Methanomassiliicoccaceae archaeon]
MSSPSRFDDVFASLPLPAKIWIFMWSYLAVSGWFSTYTLISSIGGTRRNDMIQTLMPGDVFTLTAIIMMLSSLVVIGLLFYGRYTRKKKDVVKEAVKRYEETKIFTDPKMKFDLTVLIFWIGGAFLNVLFSLCLFVAALIYVNAVLDPPILYVLVGFGISFFAAVPMYLITQFMANGVLDAKAVKGLVRTVIGSDGTKKVISLVCTKLGIMEKETVDRVYEKVRDKIRAAEYSELTPDEMLAISKAISENSADVHKPDGIFRT